MPECLKPQDQDRPGRPGGGSESVAEFHAVHGHQDRRPAAIREKRVHAGGREDHAHEGGGIGRGLKPHGLAAVAGRLLGRLPALLHIHTYRYRKHVGPEYDWDLGYRSREEVESHMAHDPDMDARLSLLRDRRGPSVEAMEQDVRRQVHEAFERAERAPWPSMGSR